MDVIERLERENQNLSWADWMDELLKENFEKKARAWSRRRVEPASTGTVKSKEVESRQVGEPA